MFTQITNARPEWGNARFLEFEFQIVVRFFKIKKEEKNKKRLGSNKIHLRRIIKPCVHDDDDDNNNNNNKLPSDDVASNLKCYFIIMFFF